MWGRFGCNRCPSMSEKEVKLAAPLGSVVAGRCIAMTSLLKTMDWRSHIASDPTVLRGTVCVRGTRIPLAESVALSNPSCAVSVVLDNLSTGASAEETIRSYPSLSLEDVQASVAYAAELARER